MALVCAISEEVPETPVISPVSGSIFERRLIEKCLNENGDKDPVNGEPLTKDMLIEVKTPPFLRPKAPTATSIPAILKSLQDEWDAVMLHAFQMRQQLQNARQELSHTVYQNDAACRAIIRLTKEVSVAREALATLKPPQPAGYRARAAEDNNYMGDIKTDAVDAIGIQPDVQLKLQETAQRLTGERKRKGKQVPEDLRSNEDIANFKVVATQEGLHSASDPGILCLDICNNIVATGGADKNVTVFNKDSETLVATLKGHSKKVVAVACHPSEELVVSGSIDATVRVWNYQTKAPHRVIRAHEKAITGLSIHATGDYVLSSSLDKSWAFSDIRTGAILAKNVGEDAPLTSARFHPDGLIFATGTQKCEVKIWDLKEQTNVADFPGHTGAVTSMSFSENGYYLATAADDFTVRLWDLRKLKNFKTISLDEGYNITDVTFDQSGTYLAFTGNDLRIYNTKSWNQVAIFEEHSALGTGVRFGPSASYIASSSLDRTLKILA